MGEVVIILKYHLSRDTEHGFNGDLYGTGEAFMFSWG